MFKNKKSHANTRRPSSAVIIGILAVVGLIITVGAIWSYSNYRKSKPADVPSQTEEALPPGKTEGLDENTLPPDKPGQETGGTNSGTNPAQPTGPTSSMHNIFQQSNGELVVQTKITGTSVGTCQLSIQVGNQTVQKSANIIYQAEYSTCAGFSIPSSELTAGSATLRLSISDGTKEVSSDTKTFIIKK